MDYQCQNCGASLPLTDKKGRIQCSSCLSINLVLRNADGTISLALFEGMVQDVKNINTKADKILTGQEQAALREKMEKERTETESILAATIDQFNEFMECEFRPLTDGNHENYGSGRPIMPVAMITGVAFWILIGTLAWLFLQFSIIVLIIAVISGLIYVMGMIICLLLQRSIAKELLAAQTKKTEWEHVITALKKKLIGLETKN